MPRDTLIDFFHDLAQASGEFLIHDDGFRSRHFTYRQVGAASRGFAARLSTLGIGKGDKVVFFSENRPEWIVAFWGCLIAGVVVVPIDYRASPDFLTRVSRIVSARLVLVGDEVPDVASVGVPVWRLRELAWNDGEPTAVSVTRTDVAEIIFTSGATADPKGVIITHANVLANIVPIEREILKYRKWGKPFFPIRFLNLLPLSHMFGQAMATFIPPMLPGIVVFIRGYNPVEIAAQIKKRRISVLISVPKILEVLRDHASRVAPDEGRAPYANHNAWVRISGRWWQFRNVHRMFGLKFWGFIVGAAPLARELELFWGERGFAVIQGYGLTETAPIVSLNHPFSQSRGSVGKAMAGVEIKIADDGEILVRGDNVTTGYFDDAEETAHAFEGGWFHTGDVGEIGADGQLFIRGRKKEMIVTPEGLNVFPEDIERVLNDVEGVRESAVVGAPSGAGSEERVTAVLIVDRGIDADAIVRDANSRLADHQKIRRVLVWQGAELPRTEGTKKLKRGVVRSWVLGATQPAQASTQGDPLTALVAKYAGRSDLSPATTLDELGLSSLERIELMVALEDAFQAPIDEGAFASARDIAQLRTLVEQPAAAARPPEPVDFPRWNRSWWARAVRRTSLPTWILPLARVFAWLHVEGVEHLAGLDRPVIFASNHQSHMDVPVVLAAMPPRIRYRVASAMAKEFFKAHFFPDELGRAAWFTNSLNYYLAALFFNAFPLPQREAGARQTLRYIGDVLERGFSVLIFPEGKRSETGEIGRFRPGIGMIAAKLGAQVVPVRIDGLQNVLRPSWYMARPGRVSVKFGAPLTLSGADYDLLTSEVETAVRHL